MKLIHIIGRQNQGKTALVVDLVSYFTGLGIVVGTIKHTGHSYELDTPGKDSYLHRQAGAVPAAMVAGQMLGVWLPRTLNASPYEQLAPMFAGCRFVIVEGDVAAPGIKLEVWRQAIGGEFIAANFGGVHAVISDDCIDAPAPVWQRSDVAALAQRILALLA